ncbi:hypothetical protein CKF58_00035 [Psittacicella hinzii]|uniref:Uncharacterized protein n=2 Tax=Psittacicella hinzii TaxID=2028575 RepID=A0A3A1YTJ0_9GAMM|nr:hypothetical protein CKF58_00035 [Psittacicella hinzii]
MVTYSDESFVTSAQVAYIPEAVNNALQQVLAYAFVLRQELASVAITAQQANKLLQEFITNTTNSELIQGVIVPFADLKLQDPQELASAYKLQVQDYM